MSDVKTGSGEFRQQVRMAAVQVTGLRPEELAQALAYELEPLSGIPANEAEVTYRPVVDADPTVRVYDVAVRRRARRNGAAGGLGRWLRPVTVLAALVVLAAVCDGGWIAFRRAALERTVNERRPLQAQLDRLASETRAARETAAAIRARREAAVRAQDEAAGRRAAHADVLGDLASACGGGSVLTLIAAGDGPHDLCVRAVDVSGEAAAGMMQKLSAAVSGKGWLLVPGEIVGSGTGATASFSFQLKRTR